MLSPERKSPRRPKSTDLLWSLARHQSARQWVPQVRGPHEQVFVRGVKFSLRRPGKARIQIRCHPERSGVSESRGQVFVAGVGSRRTRFSGAEAFRPLNKIAIKSEGFSPGRIKITKQIGRASGLTQSPTSFVPPEAAPTQSSPKSNQQSPAKPPSPRSKPQAPDRKS